MNEIIEKENIVVFEGIIGNNCGLLSPYIGADKRLLEKGFVVNGGIPVLRGFAKISDLALVSTAKYEEYQRQKDENHTEKIKSFLDNCKNEAKFLPEIILSVSDPAKITLKKYEHKSISSTTAKGVVENMGYYLIEVTGQALSRVDGNHRLEAGEGTDYYVPFSIILWDNEIWNDPSLLYSMDISKNIESEAFLFYFLNSTAKRLEIDENYKGLVNSKDWEDHELAKINPILPIIRHFQREWLDNPRFKCKWLEDKPLIKVVNALLNIDTSELSLDEFDKFMHITTQILYQDKELQYVKKYYSDIIVDLVFYTVFMNKSQNASMKVLDSIDKWLKKFRHQTNEFINGKILYDIVIKQLDTKEINIFVAMPYYDDETVGHYNEILVEACKTINDSGCSSKVLVYPIMKYKGKMVDIEEDIIRKINECDIFIADISTSNPNVMYELGLASQAKKKIIILKKKNDHAKVPSDISLKYRRTFGECYDLRRIIHEDLKTILSDDFFAIFHNE